MLTVGDVGSTKGGLRAPNNIKPALTLGLYTLKHNHSVWWGKAQGKYLNHHQGQWINQVMQRLLLNVSPQVAVLVPKSLREHPFCSCRRKLTWLDRYFAKLKLIVVEKLHIYQCGVGQLFQSCFCIYSNRCSRKTSPVNRLSLFTPVRMIFG